MHNNLGFKGIYVRAERNFASAILKTSLLHQTYKRMLSSNAPTFFKKQTRAVV
jgi:hypothetical protein